MAKSLLETLKNMPQQGGFNAPAVNPLLDPSAAFSPTVNPIEAPVDIPQGGTLPQAPPQTIGAQPFTPSFGAEDPVASQGGQFRVAPDGPFVEPTSSPALPEGFFPSTPAPAPAEGGGVLDFFFGNPTPEQAQRTLQTQPTDPAQRERLQSIAQGTAAPSDLSQTGSFFFGRPEVAGDPNILGAAPVAEPTIATEAPSASPTPTQPQAPAPDGSQIPKFGEEGFQFAERGSPQDFFLSQTNDGTTALSQEQIDRGQAFADQRGMNFDPLTGFSQGTEAAPQQGLATAGGQPLGEFLAGGQQLDAQGRMINPKVDRSFFEQQSAEREARQAARPDFGEAVSDRERRAARGDGISDADRRDMAKANRPGASVGDVARGNKVAARAGIDLRTGQPVAGTETSLETAQKVATLSKTVQDTEIAASKEERARKAAAAGLNLTPGEQRIDTDAASDMNDWRMNGSSLAQSNITQLSGVIGDLEDGNIDTRNISDFAPMSDHVRALFNPTGQDALDKVRGVIFQSLKSTLGGQFAEKEGIRLVEAAYNPKLGAEANIDRLGALLRRTQAAATAKDASAQYFHEKGTLKGFSGAGARAAFDSSTGAQGAGGSPIRGDVNYQSDVQNKATDIMSAQ